MAVAYSDVVTINKHGHLSLAVEEKKFLNLSNAYQTNYP